MAQIVKADVGKAGRQFDSGRLGFDNALSIRGLTFKPLAKPRHQRRRFTAGQGPTSNGRRVADVCHGFSKFTSGRPDRCPWIIHGLPSSRPAAFKTASAGALRWTVLRPVFESGRCRHWAWRSTYSHRSPSTSESRHPVRINSRTAVITAGRSFAAFSASARTSPSTLNSSADKNRSRLSSRYFSTCRQGFEPSGRSPHRSARFMIFDNKARTRFAWYGVSRKD